MGKTPVALRSMVLPASTSVFWHSFIARLCELTKPLFDFTQDRWIDHNTPELQYVFSPATTTLVSYSCRTHTRLPRMIDAGGRWELRWSCMTRTYCCKSATIKIQGWCEAQCTAHSREGADDRRFACFNLVLDQFLGFSPTQTAFEYGPHALWNSAVGSLDSCLPIWLVWQALAVLDRVGVKATRLVSWLSVASSFLRPQL